MRKNRSLKLHIDRCPYASADCNQVRPILPFVTFCVFLWPSVAAASPFSFDDITYWVGSGSNRAAAVIDWSDESSQPSLAWGYRWDGPATGRNMLLAIIADDPRLFAKIRINQGETDAVFGLGYDANDDGLFGVSDLTEFDSQGFAFMEDPPDDGLADDENDYYAEGWFHGFWHYGVASTNPYDGGSWSDTGVGMKDRELADDSWDSWTFSRLFNFGSFAESPIAAEPPFAQGDFDHDGHVDAADYAVWRSTFGSASQLAADANHDGVVNAADYSIWRHVVAIAGNGNASITASIPEPSNVLFVALLFLPLVVRRKPLMNVNRSLIRIPISAN